MTNAFKPYIASAKILKNHESNAEKKEIVFDTKSIMIPPSELENVKDGDELHGIFGFYIYQ